MSATARALVVPISEPDAAPRRHLDIAPSRVQRRARPRVYGAIVAIAGIGAILLAQLLMSIVLADGAYQISALQIEKRDIIREQNAATEQLQQLSSTQNLLQNAQALGMGIGGNPIYLDISSGQALGVAAPAKGQIVGSGGNLIGNVLLADGSTLLTPEAIAAAHGQGLDATITTTPVNGIDAVGVAPVPTVPGTIPSPTTR